MGSVVRSSPQMCRKMTQYIRFKHKVIVELGAGDGVITEYILDKMPSDGCLMVFEINPDLCAILSKIDDPRFILINDGAQHLDKYLQEYKLGEVDMIISALPFLVLPESLMYDILDASKKALKSGGEYIQMHYAHTLKKVYEETFGNIDISYVPFNIPPGLVYKCIKI
jgi:phosphatidylethanolamine/phosphatidyl-N-methylethanolamine N-methyltransferase